MGFFNDLIKKDTEKNPEKIFLGAPEAEAEATPHAKMKLLDVYHDYFDLLREMNHEKFIILGKKGSGKSAFAEYVCLRSQNEPNIFSKFIKQSECNLEYVVQVGKDKGLNIDRSHLFTWLILTNILNLIFSKENDVYKEYNLLQQFLKKNSGYIDINENQIKSLVEERGFEINIEYLKRFFTSKLNKNISITSQKAEFYKLIPHLKEVIKSVLNKDCEEGNENSYIIFFDDLDIVFKSKDEDSKESLIALLRTAKEMNKEFASLNVKVIILLRDDIYKSIIDKSADSGKLLSSYGTYINWYQDEYNRDDKELVLYIRKFINKRIEYAFQSVGWEYNKNDPWLSLVKDPFDNNDIYTNTSFKYILLHTLMRPRDLITFFKPLSLSSNYNYPLSKDDVNRLIEIYSDELIIEIKNELSNFYDESEITFIFNAIGEMSQIKDLEYSKAVSIIKENLYIDKDDDAEIVLRDLFDRSIIGKITENRYTYFKHRESKHEKYELSKKDKIIVHNTLEIYCKKKGFSK